MHIHILLPLPNQTLRRDWVLLRSVRAGDFSVTMHASNSVRPEVATQIVTLRAFT